MLHGFTFDAIQPLIHSSAVHGRALTVTFRCPRTGALVHGAWSAPPIGVSAVTTQVQATPLGAVRHQVNGMIRGLLGYGHLGRAARTLADTALTGAHPDAVLSTTEEERGLVEAFRGVSYLFAWTDGRWVHASVVGQDTDSLRAQVAAQPELSAYDRDIAARMVIAVARAHGGISDEERLHLGDLFDGELGSLEGLLRRPELTRAELAETSAGPARRAILGVAWAMALCDEHFDAAERAVLDGFAAGLGLDLEVRVEVARQAAESVLEQWLERAHTWGEHDRAARDGLHALAARIGVSEGAAARIEARFRKRRQG